MAVFVLTCMAPAAAVAAGPAGFRLCDNPQEQYVVVAVHRLSCKAGRRHGRIWARYRHVPGWHCSPPKPGMYFGLYGARSECRRGRAKFRVYSRGE